MKRRKSGGSYRREKAVMVASTVLVLTAMTVTGVYVYSSRPEEPEGNVVDFSALEQETEEVAEAENKSAKNLTSGEGDSGELDYDPYYAPVSYTHLRRAEYGGIFPGGDSYRRRGGRGKDYPWPWRCAAACGKGRIFCGEGSGRAGDCGSRAGADAARRKP